MTSVGIRELRQRASELLRRVRQGETIEITDRGEPVALLTPMPQGGVLERMIAVGDVEPATLDLEEIEPIELPRGAEPPSKVLERLRRDER